MKYASRLLAVTDVLQALRDLQPSSPGRGVFSLCIRHAKGRPVVFRSQTVEPRVSISLGKNPRTRFLR